MILQLKDLESLNNVCLKDKKEYEKELKAAEETLGAVQSCVKGAQTFLEASSQNKMPW